MELYYKNQNNEDKPLVTQNGSVPVTGVQNRVLEAFEDIDYNVWDIVQGDGDTVTVGGNTAGSGYVRISKSIDKENTETVFTSKFIVKPAFRFGLGMSLSQRIGHQRFSIELVGVDRYGNEVATVPVAAPVNVTSMSQASTTLTITTATNHGFVPGDRINISGAYDSRLNYGEVYVATVISPTQFTVTATPSATIPSVTATSSTGVVAKVEPFGGADNAMSITWEGTSSSNAKVITRTNKSVLFNSPDTSFGTSNTNATVANSGAFADAFNPAYIYDVKIKTESLIVRSMPVDSVNGQGGLIKRTQTIPDIAEGYKIRLRARNNTSMSKVVGTILNQTKSGSTTATITTDVPHGLTPQDYVTIYGARDQTNFATLTTPGVVVTAPDAYTVTVAYGASATASSRGGVLVKTNGGFNLTGASQSIQSLSISNGLMTLVGNTNWSGLAIGETVEVRGLVDASAATQYPQYEGIYQIANISTTSLVLYTTLPDTASINLSGAVFKRTDFRLHILRVLDYTRQAVEIDSGMGNYSDFQESIGVNVLGGSLGVSSGQAAHDAAVSGNPVRVAGRGMSANYTTIASGDVADLVTTLVGALIVKPYAIPEMEYQVTGAITTTADLVIKAASTTNKNYVTSIQVQNVGSVATDFVLKDGSTVIYKINLPASMAAPIDTVFQTPLKTSALNVAMNAACLTTGANVYVNAQGYQAP